MLLYLLLIIAFGILMLAAVGLLIFGLIKKQKNVLVVAAVLFLGGTIGCIFSAITYTKKAIEYAKSGELQKDVRKGAELVGKTAGSVASGLSEGVATTLDEDAIKQMAMKAGLILGKSVKTIASGLDSTVGNKLVILEKQLEVAGLEPGRAEEKTKGEALDLEVFIDYQKDFTGTIRITNYDQTGKKIDAVDKRIDVKAGQGKVEVFSFKHAETGVTTYYILSKVD